MQRHSKTKKRLDLMGHPALRFEHTTAQRTEWCTATMVIAATSIYVAVLALSITSHEISSDLELEFLDLSRGEGCW